MKNYTIKPYEPQDYALWNDFISKSKNATFLFHRDFMEYHSDRFQDYSLIVMEGNKWVAVLPANRVGDAIFSHQGLTYGGLVYNEKTKLTAIIGIFRSLLFFLNQNKIDRLNLKLIPSIYHNKPAEEINYALFLADAQLVRRDALAVLDLTKAFSFSKERNQCVRRGLKNGLVIKEETNLKPFWEEILLPNLALKHQVKPIHTLEEIEKLQKLFPSNIRHFNVYYKNKIVAGSTVFVTKNVLHPQYISGRSNKNELGSLDFLYHYLITDVFKDKHFFDFGISNEEQGRKLNEGLVFWKETFGTNTIVHDFYDIKTENFNKLENVLI